MGNVILNGGRGPKRSANFSAAMRRSAERRRCPQCDRKSALSRVYDPWTSTSVTSCRWCDYSVTRVKGEVVEPK